jgi:hypothetical protein
MPCGHSFCKACITHWLELPASAQRPCPLGCAIAAPVVSSLSTNFSLQDTVGELRIRCRFGLRDAGGEWAVDPKGCPEQPRIADAAAHDAACGFAVVVCAFAGCGVEMQRSAAPEHDAREAVSHARGERAARKALETRVAALERGAAGLEALRRRVDAIDVRVGGCEREVVAVKGWLAGQAEATEGLEASIDETNGRLQGTQGEVAALTALLLALGTAVDQLGERMRAQAAAGPSAALGSLRGRVDAIESRLDERPQRLLAGTADYERADYEREGW